MFRPDRDSHIKVMKTKKNSKNFKIWNIGDGRHNESEISKLITNYDINSILHYRPFYGTKAYGMKALNPYYNEVGFGDSYKMTATDKVALNIFLSCPTIKRKVYEEYQEEEINRNYIELMNLIINPNVRSQR